MERQLLQELSKTEGLVLLGIVTPSYDLAFSRYQKWLTSGMHADMQYLERNLELRRNPSKLLPEARSVVVFGLPYGPDQVFGTDNSRAALYAQYPDYHHILKKKISKVWKSFSKNAPETTWRVLVDSAPLLERALAEKSEKGFVGKNTFYIHPQFGSFLLLGELISTLKLPTDEPEQIVVGKRTAEGGCGTCSACQVSCPTGALNDAYQIDSRKCLAYWTIENRGIIPTSFWKYMDRYWFGCDICQNVCPYNTWAKPLPIPTDFIRQRVPDLVSVATMNEVTYQRYFRGTPFTRAKRAGLRRNALIALVVTKHPELERAIKSVQDDPQYPLIETVSQIEAFCVS